MAYPKTLYRIVNTVDEEKVAVEQGCTVDPSGAPILEYPKMLYAHPVDKTKEHKTLVVNTPEEKDDALANGYKVEPHIPVAEGDYAFEETQYEVSGSGSERWPEATDWAHTEGAGLTDNTSEAVDADPS